MNKKIIALFATVLLIFACKKEDKIQPIEEPLANQTQNMSLSFSNLANNSPLNFTTTYTTSSGARYKLKSFRYYVSNIKLVRDNGSEYAVSGKYLLVNPAVSDYDLGVVPVDSYIGIRFSIGIDSLTNHKDPTVYEPSNPLAIQSPGIHWSWNSGYIFMMLEGSCDTTATNSDVLNPLGEYNHSLFYHIGTDKFYKNVNLTRHFHVTETSPYQLKIGADLDKLFDNVDIRKQNATHTMGSIPLATLISGNIPSMFSVIP